MRGAVLPAVGDNLEIRSLDTVEPDEHQVKVRLAASGVCHTDLSLQQGVIPHPMPCVPGHEGAGQVVAVGARVTSLTPGDHVVLAWVAPCGTCYWCLRGQANLCMAQMGSMMSPPFLHNGQPIFAGLATGTFAEETVVHETAAIRIPKDVPLDLAALIGCGVTTGVGAVLNTAKVSPGSSVAVFGCGGVGVNVIQGARLAGAAVIVAVDLVEEKLEQARVFGATHVAHPDELAALSQQLTDGIGFDYTFEAVGRPVTARAAFDAARRGGTAVIVGAGRAEEELRLNMFEIPMFERRLLGSLYGSSDVRLEFPRLVRLWQQGKLLLEPLVSQRIKLDAVNDAFDAMEGGSVIRTLIEY